jgi:collagenase-like PrtC family protease
MTETSMYKMRFDLATNFDPNLIAFVNERNAEGAVSCVFGKLRSDVLGGGRNAPSLPKVSMKELRDHVALCHQSNLKFNYLLNPLCLDNREISVRGHRKLLRFIGELADIGVDGVTINSPFLCRLIRKQFPRFEITIGYHSGIGSIQQVKYWEELGADVLTLTHSVNRNFPLLTSLLAYTKRSGPRLRLIANNVCLRECPFKLSHGTSNAHASQSGHGSSGFFIDYNLLNCTYRKIANPANLIASEWIRPEDITYYEALCQKTGNHKLSIKLLERTKKTAFLTRVVQAYLDRSYDGNLLEIMAWPDYQGTDFKILPAVWNAMKGGYNLREIGKFMGFFRVPPIVIENKKLDGFLEKFITDGDCARKICNGVDCLTEEPGHEQAGSIGCGYCQQWVRKAVRYDPDEVNAWLRQAEESMEIIHESRLFYFKRAVSK